VLLGGFIFLAIVAVGISVAGYYLLYFPERGLPGRLSVHDIGRIEGTLPGLLRVIVIADQVEDPTNELRKAVEKNLANGVHYLFLVSKSRGQTELDGYYLIFKTIKVIITKRLQRTDGIGTVDIQELPYDWPDYPYVFYETEDQAGSISFVAFRGNQPKEGIAEFYSQVDAHYAYTIARAVLSEAPQPIQVTADQFADGSNVVPYPTQKVIGENRKKGEDKGVK
jgi:hypothetical protein